MPNQAMYNYGMIDLHSHILPKLCDGSPNLDTSLEMARIAVADGITHLACTPHIYPGVYANSTSTILPAMQTLQAALQSEGIPLQLVMGADVHMIPEVMAGLKNGTIPTLHGSRYFLLEPSHHVPVPNFLAQVENFIHAGYVPIITHPERLRWLEEHYQDFIEAVRLGAWLQLTAGAITGEFGRNVKHWAERLLLDGVVHLIASDAHGVKQRPPILSKAVEATITILDDEAEVMCMVRERPQAILQNIPPEKIAAPSGASDLPNPALLAAAAAKKKGWFRRLLG